MTPVALVTGASRGLGRGIAIQLAQAGYSVAINYAGNSEAAEACAVLCAEAAGAPEQRFEPVQGDIGDAVSRQQLLEQTLAHFGRLDALVNNAGIAPKQRADILDASEDSFAELMRVNLQGPYFLTQAVARHWLQAEYKPLQPQGFCVVFVGSISAHTVSVSRGEYCVSKAGLGMATQLWSTRLAEHGIPVYEVRPGIMKTDMTAAVTEKYDALIADGLVPQKRWGTPADIGQGVASLLRGNFPFSTGTVIDIDGGFHLRRL
jgi:3-oxoacyl-[acyl-carrier protein] reductase